MCVYCIVYCTALIFITAAEFIVCALFIIVYEKLFLLETIEFIDL